MISQLPLVLALATVVTCRLAASAPVVSRELSQATPAAESACFTASSWTAADALFRGDPHWVGGDGASSVDLGNGRILWLFGDSWIDPSGAHTRRGATLVSNSVAIQFGSNPTTASMHFYWGHTQNGRPRAFVPDDGNERHWFGNGVRVGDQLVLFLNRVRNASGGLGFASIGWTAWSVENPDAEPDVWRMHRLKSSANTLGVLVGFAAATREGDSIYAFGSADPVKSHPIYAVRWRADDLRRKNLSRAEWWAGNRVGWVREASTAVRQPIFENGQSELTIHWDRATQLFLGVQTQGFGAADLMIRQAPSLTGPWSTPRLLFHPPEQSRPKAMIYSAKAHPELTGGNLIVTYATNSFLFEEQLADAEIYYPRFVRLTRCTAQ